MQRRSRFDLTRRRLLQSLGLGAVAGPFIPLLNADAQTALRPKRLLLLFTPDGSPARDFSPSNTVDWRPTGPETAFTLQAMYAPLAPFQSKIMIPGGLTMSAGGAGEAHAYGMAGLWSGTTLPGPGAGVSFDGGNGHLTGWGAAATLDQVVAQAYGPAMVYAKSPTDATQETKYRSIALGVQCGGPNTLNRMTYTAANAPISPEVNPKTAYDRYFAGVTASGGATPPPTGPADPTAARIRAERQATLDLLKGEIPKIRATVGSADFQKIDAHLEGLLALERLNTSAGTPPTPPPVGSNCGLPPASADVASASNNAGYPTQVKQMMDIATGLLACDVTRVLTLQLSYAFSNVVHTWLGHTKGHHTMCHDGIDERTPLSAIDLWYSQQVAYLLGKLDAVSEGSGTLLDNTLIVWGHENGSTAHRQDNVPFMLAGKAGGALRTGRFVNFQGKPHAALLVSVAQLMGLPTTSFGNINMNTGPLAGLA
jgi:hypothetical protein